MSHIPGGRGFRRLNEIDTHRLPQEVFETFRWIRREKGCDLSVVVIGSIRSTAYGRAIMTRIAPYLIAALALGLSACTNLYDPVQRDPTGLWLPKPPAILSLFRFWLWRSHGWLSRRSAFRGLVDGSRVRYPPSS